MKNTSFLGWNRGKIMAEKPCSILLYENNDSINVNELKKQLEEGEEDVKIRTMKKIIVLCNQGEKLPGVLMHVIRFVMPLKNHTLKKLMLLFFEVIEKSQDGKLLPEMILVW